MKKSTFIILSIIILIGGYFLYQYQTDRILNDIATRSNIDGVNYNDSANALSPAMKSAITDFIAANRANVIEGTKPFYYAYFYKEKDIPYVRISSNTQLDKKAMIGYIYLDQDQFVYYGNRDSIMQTLINASKLSSFDDFFDAADASAQKPLRDTIVYERDYQLVNSDSLRLIFEGIR